MKYPKKLTQRANEILSAQRQAAYAKQTKALDWLVKNHLDIAEAKQKIRVLSAKRRHGNHPGRRGNCQG